MKECWCFSDGEAMAEEGAVMEVKLEAEAEAVSEVRFEAFAAGAFSGSLAGLPPTGSSPGWPRASGRSSQSMMRVLWRRNKREQNRTKEFNNRYADLRNCIPNLPVNTKVRALIPQSHVEYTTSSTTAISPIVLQYS